MDVDSTTPKYLCYLITNIVNGKRYIGQTRLSLKNRWKRHVGAALWKLSNETSVHLLHKAIRKYGAANFSQQVLLETNSQSVLKEEQRLIREYNTYMGNGRGYNMTLGGEGSVGYIFTESDKAKMSKAKMGRKTGPCSEKRRKSISEAKKGIYTLTPEQSKQRSLRMKGRTVPKETRQKIREGMKRVWAERKSNAS